MDTGELISLYRKQAGMTVDELAEKAGIPRGTLTKIIGGTTKAPTLENMKAIARALGKTLADFDNDIEPSEIFSASELQMIKKYRGLDAHGKRIVNSVLDEETRRMAEEKAAKEKAAKAAQEMEAAEEIAPIRYIRHYLVPSAAGFASPVEGEDYEMIEAGSEVPANADFCIEISGDSMEPYIKDGQRVYVQRDVNVREFDDAGIWYYAGDVYCKQYCIDFSGALILLSANRKRRNFDKWISKEERVNVVCYGRVILPFKLPQPEP